MKNNNQQSKGKGVERNDTTGGNPTITGEVLTGRIETSSVEKKEQRLVLMIDGKPVRLNMVTDRWRLQNRW